MIESICFRLMKIATTEAVKQTKPPRLNDNQGFTHAVIGGGRQLIVLLI
jgi:hypothetical protein